MSAEELSAALFTDFYELTMAQAYWQSGRTAPATFSLYFRRLPPDRGYLVFAGLADALDYLERFRFSSADIAYLRNPTNPHFSTPETSEMQAAAALLGLRLLLLDASNAREIDEAFAHLVAHRAGALLLGTDPLFVTARDQVVALANRYRVPAIYPFREDVVAGGLMNYGASNLDAYHIVGGYTGRILKGEKPADLPVRQPSKFDLVINLKTAKALGLKVSQDMLSIADEVIE